MKKTTLLQLLIIILLAGYSGVWFLASSNDKKAVEAWLESVHQSNENLAIKHGPVKVSGFPLRYTIEIPDVRLTVQSGKLIQQWMDDQEGAGAIQWPTEQWVDTITLGKNITITSGALKQHFTMKIGGDLQVTSVVGTKTTTINGLSDVTNGTVVNLQKPLLIAALSSNANISEALEKYLAHFEMRLLNAKWVDDKTHETLTNIPDFSVQLDNNLSDGTIHFTLSAKDLESTAALDRMILENPYMVAIMQHQGGSNDLLPSASGKTNAEFDISFTHEPGDTSLPSTDRKHTDLQIAKANLSNELISFQSQGSITLERFDNKSLKEAAIKLKTSGHSTEKNYALQQKKLVNAVTLIASEQESPETPGFSSDLFHTMAVNLSKLEDKGASIAPKIYELGQINVNLDMHYSSDEIGAKKEIKFNNFDVTAEPYGLKITGTAGTNETTPIPSGTVHLTLLQYQALVDDLGAYIKNIYGLLSQADPDTFYIQVNDELLNASTAFLKEISDTPAEEVRDLTVTIASNPDSMMPKIGTLDGMQVMQLYAEKLAPFFVPPPMKEGIYDCTCTRSDTPCFTQDISKAPGEFQETFLQGTQHTGLPLAKVTKLYGPRRTGMDATGWSCALQGKHSTATSINAPIEPTAAGYATAFNNFKTQAEGGDAKAMFHLGAMYQQGLGTAVDDNKAIYWLEQSAKHGYADARKALEEMQKLQKGQ